MVMCMVASGDQWWVRGEGNGWVASMPDKLVICFPDGLSVMSYGVINSYKT